MVEDVFIFNMALVAYLRYRTLADRRNGNATVTRLLSVTSRAPAHGLVWAPWSLSFAKEMEKPSVTQPSPLSEVSMYTSQLHPSKLLSGLTCFYPCL